MSGTWPVSVYSAFVNDRYDLSTPRSRREALRLVSLDDPAPDHALLRQIFDYELAWRESPEEGAGDEFENIYLCAFLPSFCSSLATLRIRLVCIGRSSGQAILTSPPASTPKRSLVLGEA